VERHLRDGDLVVVDQQPSLSRQSMMCHKVKVVNGLTIQMNPCLCTTYNSDFDGNEMTLHVPQTEEARAEALILMGSQNNLVSSCNGMLLTAPIQVEHHYICLFKIQNYNFYFP